MERCQYLHRLDSNSRHYLIHLSFLWYWIQLLYASFSSVSSCFALHWILHCIQDISHFRGLVGAFCAGGGWEKIWVFVDMHQQSTSKGLVSFMHSSFVIFHVCFQVGFVLALLRICAGKGMIPCWVQCMAVQMLKKPIFGLKKLLTLSTLESFNKHFLCKWLCMYIYLLFEGFSRLLSLCLFTQRVGLNHNSHLLQESVYI